MRKLIVVFLLITGTASTLSAQYNPYYYMDPYTTAAEALFNNPRPGKARVNFTFYGTTAGWIRLELVSIKQMEHLPDLDSILNIAKSALLHISDSLKEDAINRRIDVLVDSKRPVQLRITSHANRPATFFVQQDELAILKTEQDTLRIKFMVPTGVPMTYYNDGKKEIRPETAPAFIMIGINNFDRLRSMPEDIMQKCLALLRQEITSEYVRKASSQASYNASYNLQTNKRFGPTKRKWIRYGAFNNELVPNIYGSVQFVRGSFTPSMAAGLRFTTARSSLGFKRFYLMWEPYFFFSRDINNKLITDRNDFVTLRFIDEQIKSNKKGDFDFQGNVSFGYLTRRQGNWFEKNTFKIGLPAVRSGWLQLEPELFFNDFVKNFSPSLKLTLHYE